MKVDVTNRIGAFVLALLLSVLAWTAVEGQQDTLPDPITWADTTSVFIEPSNVAVVEPPAEYLSVWEQVRTCLGDHVTEEPAFEDIVWVRFSSIDVLLFRSFHAPEQVALWGAYTAEFTDPAAIFIRQDHMYTATVRHEMIHAYCPECPHRTEVFRVCAGEDDPSSDYGVSMLDDPERRM